MRLPSRQHIGSAALERSSSQPGASWTVGGISPDDEISFGFHFRVPPLLDRRGGLWRAGAAGNMERLGPGCRHASVTSLIAPLRYNFKLTQLLCGRGQDVEWWSSEKWRRPLKQEGVSLIIYWANILIAGCRIYQPSDHVLSRPPSCPPPFPFRLCLMCSPPFPLPPVWLKSPLSCQVTVTSPRFHMWLSRQDILTSLSGCELLWMWNNGAGVAASVGKMLGRIEEVGVGGRGGVAYGQDVIHDQEGRFSQSDERTLWREESFHPYFPFSSFSDF